MGIKAKILIPVMIIIPILVAAILLSNILLFSDFVDNAVVDKVDSTTNVAAYNLDSLKNSAVIASLRVAEDPEIVDAIVNGNREKLLSHAEMLQNEIGVEFCTITDTAGTVLIRTHAPEVYGDSIAFQSNIQGAIQGTVTAAVEEGKMVLFSARAGAPVFDSQGLIVGVVSVGYRLDTEKFVDSMKKMTGCEITIVLGDTRISTTVLQEDGTRAVGTKADAHIVETVMAGNQYSGHVDILGRPTIAHYIPIYGPDGPIGMMFIGQYVDASDKTIHAFVRGGIIITSVMLLASIIIIVLIIKRIVAPIQTMTMAAKAMAVGDTDINVKADTNDEMRTLADAFNSMIENTRQQVQLVERIADGDLTATLQERSDKDLMNRALQKLNTTIQEQAAEIREEQERIELMLDATPLAARLWDKNAVLIDCNEAAVKLFGLNSKKEYIERYYELSPECQPGGERTRDKIKMMVSEVFEKGECTYDWESIMPDGTALPTEITMVKVPYKGDYVAASYSRDLRAYKKMMAEIELRDKLLNVINQVATTLLRAETDDFTDTLHQCMGMMAQAVQSERMNMFKNYTEDGKLYCTQICEWSEKDAPTRNSFTAAKFSYDDTPEFKKMYLRGECVNMLVRDMPPTEHALSVKQGVLSVLVVPIFIRNKFWGFVGFDNCHTERLFTENEESILRSASLLLTNAVLRNEYMLDIQEAAKKLEVALDVARNANEAKSSFLAQMSHEMRTPLNAVIGLSELMLSEDNIDWEVETNLEKICNAGSTLLSIINDLLDISKIEAGKFELCPVQYDTPSLINDIVTQNVVRIGEKPITFKLFADENLPGILYGDDLRVKQIFNNLLSNAFKYTNAGTVEWRITFEREANSIVLISEVKDTGIGIKPGDLSKLFTDYKQMDVKINRRVGGTGLGLTIAKRLLEMMDGSITISSEYGKGTIVSVRLRQEFVSGIPIGREVAENLVDMRYNISKRAKNTKLARINMSYAHVLVVDDVVTNLDVVKGMMKPYKMKIDCVTSGPQAIDAIRSENPRYNAIFMDHMMPGMDGIEATQLIREIGTDYALKIPIIALTANAIAGNEEMFLNQGFQAFISKPIDMVRMDSVLRHWVRDKSREKEFSDAELMNGEGTINGGSLLENIPISSMDKYKALKRFGGNESTLIDVLRSYAANTPPLMDSLNDYLAAENLNDYAIIIHGIKSSSYSINAQESGKAAAELEEAAKSGNLEAVKEGHRIFEKTMADLLKNINNALYKINTMINKPVAAKPDPALLTELREACGEFDMDRVDKAIAQLESFRYESGGDLVTWLRRMIDNMTFEEISSGEWPFN